MTSASFKYLPYNCDMCNQFWLLCAPCFLWFPNWTPGMILTWAEDMDIPSSMDVFSDEISDWVNSMHSLLCSTSHVDSIEWLWEKKCNQLFGTPFREMVGWSWMKGIKEHLGGTEWLPQSFFDSVEHDKCPITTLGHSDHDWQGWSDEKMRMTTGDEDDYESCWKELLETDLHQKKLQDDDAERMIEEEPVYLILLVQLFVLFFCC